MSPASESRPAEAEHLATAGGPDPEPRFAYRWVAMFVVLFGSFMVVLDTTVVNLGLPSMQRDFKMVDGIEWVFTAYLATVGVAQMCSGWLADRFGRRRTFIMAMVAFTLSSALCALAPTFGVLVAARVLQGLGGGVLMPVAMAMIYELFPPAERGRALGYFGIAIMVAPAVGPVLSGTVVSSLSWRWLFLINLPVGVVGIPIAIRLLRDTGFREKRPFDASGLLLSGSGLVMFLIGISEGGIVGWSEPWVVALIAGGVLLLGLFVRHVGRVEHPLVELDILAIPVFAVAMVAVSLMSIAQFSRLVYIPLELDAVRGVSAIRIGLVMMPSALGVAATMPLGGRLVDRIGARLPVSIGISVLAVSFWGLANLDATTSLTTIAAILFAGGLGTGLAIMSPNIVAMNSVDARRVSQASGLSNVSRQIAAAVGVSLLASVFTTVRPAGDPATISAADALGPYRTVFTISVGLLLVGLVVAQFLPGKQAALALQRERSAELAALGDDMRLLPAEGV
jgi:DHA2 family multidrug resistance protein